MKRFISIALISLMVLSVFALTGCGGGSSDSGSAEPEEATQTEETADAAEGVAGQFYIYDSCIFEKDGEAQEVEEDTSQSLLFKDDGTFEYTYTDVESGELITGTGTYSDNGATVQLKFDEQYAEKIGVGETELTVDGDTLTEIIDKDYEGVGHIHREVKYVLSTSAATD